MPAFSVRYGFSQLFHVPAREAYNWCTNYESEDVLLMRVRGKRRVLRVSSDTIILIDTAYGKRGENETKSKLVRLYPEQLSWTSTHLTGPNKHSQFLYEIVPVGKTSSCLNFIGLQVEYGIANSKKVALLSRKLRKADSDEWKILTRAMEKELKQSKS